MCSVKLQANYGYPRLLEKSGHPSILSSFPVICCESPEFILKCYQPEEVPGVRLTS
jgi:hypothetical protein